MEYQSKLQRDYYEKTKQAELKPFDLKPGDIITAFDNVLDNTAKFKVIAIYPHIFSAERLDNGLVRQFQKKDYQRNGLKQKSKKKRYDGLY